MLFRSTFKNYDGTILYTTLVAEGSTCPDPVLTGIIQKPLKPADENYVYSYLGWTGASLINVTSDRILTASYSQAASYTIRFVDWDGTSSVDIISPLIRSYLIRS